MLEDAVATVQSTGAAVKAAREALRVARDAEQKALGLEAALREALLGQSPAAAAAAAAGGARKPRRSVKADPVDVDADVARLYRGFIEKFAGKIAAAAAATANKKNKHRISGKACKDMGFTDDAWKALRGIGMCFEEHKSRRPQSGTWTGGIGIRIAVLNAYMDACQKKSARADAGPGPSSSSKKRDRRAAGPFDTPDKKKRQQNK